MTTSTRKVAPSAIVIHMDGTGKYKKVGASRIAIQLGGKVISRASVGGNYTPAQALAEWKRQVNKNFTIVAGMEELHAAALKM